MSEVETSEVVVKEPDYAEAEVRALMSSLLGIGSRETSRPDLKRLLEAAYGDNPGKDNQRLDEAIAAAVSIHELVPACTESKVVATLAATLVAASFFDSMSKRGKQEYQCLIEELRNIPALAQLPQFDNFFQYPEKEALEVRVMNSPIDLGKIQVSALLRRTILPTTAFLFLSRYTNRDWGVVSEEDAETNNQNCESGEGMLFGIYQLDVSKEEEEGNLVYVITNSERTETTLMLAEEYK